MSAVLSVLKRFKAVLERPKGVKSYLKFFQSRRRAGKANELRLKRGPSSCVLAPSEHLPSEADSVSGLRQDDLAVIRSEELVVNIGELSRKTSDPHHEVERIVLKAASEGRWEEIDQVCNRLGQQERVLHAQNEFGWSPLHFAVYYGHLNIVNQLVNVCKLPPEQKTKDGRTPLMVAAGAGHLPVAKLLLETHQSNVNEEDGKSATPLMYAARGGHLPVVKVLLERGADVLHKAEESVTALHLAAYGDSLECVKYLMMPVDREKRFEMDENGRTCLHYAVWGGSLSVMSYLVDRCGFDLGVRTADGRTPLMLAASAGHLQVAKHLVEVYKCKVPEEDSEGSATALHLAAYGGSIECVKYLSSLFGDRKFEMDENRWTCLHHAVAGGSVRVVEYLVDQCKFPIDRRTGDGLTPLMLAAQFGSLSVAKLLVEKYECDVNEQSGEKSSTPMMFAAQYGHRPIVELLVNHGADVFQKAQGELVALHHAAYGGSIECVKYLLPLFGDRKFDVDENGLTCLHWAVLGGSLTVVRYLVDKCEPDLKLRTAGGLDCFLLACEEGHREIIRELLKRDEVDRNAVDEDGHGALHLAMKGGYTELVQMLVQEFGFPPDTSDNVSSLQAEGGSDPSEREDTSNLLADEAALKRLCWIPFGIKTVSIEAKGGILCLEPQSDGIQVAKEDTIFVEVPPDAFSTSVDVKMRYAIIPSGPFTLPEGYQFGSPVVYIDYDGQRVTKPLVLHLTHWYGGEDHARDGLSFAVAPHSLKGRDVYHFQLLGGGKFPVSSRYGIVEIGGHCSLFTTAFENRATVNCQAFSLIKENEEETECKAECNIAVTNAAYCWRMILLENRPGWEVSQPNPFQFKSDRITATLKEKSHVHGDWRAYFIGTSELLSSHVRYDVFGIDSDKALEDAVKAYAYPPAIKYIVKYRKELRRTGRSTEVTLQLHISTDQPMDFPYTAYERIQAAPPTTGTILSPALTEITSQPSLSLCKAASLSPPPMSPAQTTHTWAAHTLSVCPPLSEASSSVSPTPLTSTQSTQTETLSDTLVCPLRPTPAEFLDHFRQQFIVEVDASTIVLELEHRGIISNGDQKTISRNEDNTQQSQFLHAYLKKKCDAKALTDVCDIIATVKGNPRMKSFGEHMKTEWEKDVD